ncbi:hypothetical protein N7541_007455 [Penicillium brevicompactum]|uniref:Uncharacterized protein n=1 Tax=Penicillium brevicompactum TaxID=5074 RepID=A0A9W9QSY8_PENBR|nr:hypothetical protein N7452_002963 [Penicillium brevicompactum]KAJ5349728.1 hypothetical protein N7541_007455 [Penicillium brevicompactum]
MSKPHPLTAPAIPIALQTSHLLSPPPDRLTNTPTTLSITKESNTLYVHRLRPHEPSNSPEKQLLFTVLEKQWPTGTRVIYARNTPVLVLRRAWFSGLRKWGVKLPKGKGKARGADLLDASMPWTDGNTIGAGRGFRLDMRFRNALATRRRRATISTARDEPPPYTHAPGAGHRMAIEDALFFGSDQEIGVRSGHVADILPGYSARYGGSALHDLLDAVESPQDPAPASVVEFPPRPSSGVERSSAGAGSTVELRTVQSASGTGVMLGNHKVMHITRHNAMDYSRSKSRLKPRWEVAVAEGVDLLLAVNVVLIMTEVESPR